MLVSIFAIKRPKSSGAYVPWYMHFSKRCRPGPVEVAEKSAQRGRYVGRGVERASGILILLTSRKVVHRPRLKVSGAHAASCRMSRKCRSSISSNLRARLKAVFTEVPFTGCASSRFFQPERGRLSPVKRLGLGEHYSAALLQANLRCVPYTSVLSHTLRDRPHGPGATRVVVCYIVALCTENGTKQAESVGNGTDQ